MIIVSFVFLIAVYLIGGAYLLARFDVQISIYYNPIAFVGYVVFWPIVLAYKIGSK